MHGGVYVLQGQEFTEQYRLEFQRVTRGPWFRYRNRRRQEVSESSQDIIDHSSVRLRPILTARRDKTAEFRRVLGRCELSRRQSAGILERPMNDKTVKIAFVYIPR